jgi:arginine repressor
MKSTKEQIKNETIEKCKSIFEEFGKISLRELSDLLKKEGCDINYSTLSRMEEIKILLQKCILKNNKTKENPLYCNILDYNSNIEKSITTNPPLCSTILQQRRLNQSDSNLVAKVYPDVFLLTDSLFEETTNLIAIVSCNSKTYEFKNCATKKSKMLLFKKFF